LLKTNGLLLLNENTSSSDFSTLVFGLTDGWWLYADKYHRIKHSPLLTPDSWATLLDNSGFRDISFLNNNVIVASGDGSYHKEINAVIGKHLTETSIVENKELNLRGKKEAEDYSDTEKKIAAIWQSVLGYKEIDVNDNFFEIGGDSLLIVQVHKKLDALYPGRINIADLFSYLPRNSYRVQPECHTALIRM